MRRSPFTYILAALSIAFASFARGIAYARDFATELIETMFPAEPMRLMPSGPVMDMELGGHAVAPDVQQGLRHEAGVARRSAARHT